MIQRFGIGIGGDILITFFGQSYIPRILTDDFTYTGRVSGR